MPTPLSLIGSSFGAASTARKVIRGIDPTGKCSSREPKPPFPKRDLAD